ncbi:MAG TPA: serine/threonine-protein kinase [Roseiflexaceae bacterium]|nr:serine/threonine-protein kinase [Roseiflexaceae bacterium]
MSAAPRQLIGTRLGPYDIQALLGSGGMASVYRAFDTNLQRSVAIKVLSAGAAAQPGFVERFRQEARLIANLRHPNIVQVYDLGQHDGAIYMSQELLCGPTLEAWMCDLAARGAQAAPHEIIAIVTQLAGALGAAHAAGIIHRDVKPANAIWNERGDLVLTDFGIAKPLAGSANQTQIGVVFGTPSYLSPEQAQSLPLTPASDIYSLSIVLYELIAGQVPFRASTPMHVAIDHIQTPPPPLPARPDLPPVVEAIVRRGLAKNPTERFGTAGELAQALARAWAASSTPAASPNADIHNQATRVWQPAPAPVAPVVPGVAIPQQAPRPAAPDQFQQSLPAPSGARARLALLGALLAFLLLVGIVLAARGARSADSAASDSAAPAAQATTAATPTEQSQTAVPSVEAPSAPTFASLRAFVEAGRADGLAGPRADALLAALGAAEQALAAGDAKTAVQHFSAFQQILVDGARNSAIDAGFMVEAMKRVQSLANSQGLTLPLSVQFQ